MGQDPKSDFKKMVTALGLNVSNVSLAAAFDAAVQFVAIRFASAESGKLDLDGIERLNGAPGECKRDGRGQPRRLGPTVGEMVWAPTAHRRGNPMTDRHDAVVLGQHTGATFHAPGDPERPGGT